MRSGKLCMLIVLLLTSISSVAQSAPTITAVESDPVGAGAFECIDGHGFGATQGGSSVLLNGSAATVAAWVSDSRVCITVPETAALGVATVQMVPRQVQAT